MWLTLPDTVSLESIRQDDQPTDLVELNSFPHRNPLAPVEMRRVPLPVPTTQRAGWRVTALVLILGSCRGSSATTEQLNSLLWAISDSASAELFLSTWRSQDPQKAPLRVFFPPLDDALKIAQAEELVEQKGKVRFGLSVHGKQYLRLLNSDAELLEQEKRFLASLRPITTSGMWERLGVVKVNDRPGAGA
ncbi:hypothetical protein GCM10027294_52950 [Marinactinospora endophytica]